MLACLHRLKNGVLLEVNGVTITSVEQVETLTTDIPCQTQKIIKVRLQEKSPMNASHGYQ